MSQLKVQIGQAVQYVGITDEVKAAIVTKVYPSGAVNLSVFADDAGKILRALDVPQYVDTFDMRKTDQSHSFRVLSR